MTLNKYLKGHRKWLCLSLRDVEKKTGVSNAFICQIENGRFPSLTILKKLQKAYGQTTIETLVIDYLRKGK